MRRVQPWLPALAWAGLIFLLSARPTLPVPLESGTDKVAHFLAYAVLGALLARAQARSGMSAAGACLLGALYAASDEWHQAFVPGRSADPLDWAADVAGVVAGVTLYHWTRRRAWGGAAPLAGARTDNSAS